MCCIFYSTAPAHIHAHTLTSMRVYSIENLLTQTFFRIIKKKVFFLRTETIRIQFIATDGLVVLSYVTRENISSTESDCQTYGLFQRFLLWNVLLELCHKQSMEKKPTDFNSKNNFVI